MPIRISSIVLILAVLNAGDVGPPVAAGGASSEPRRGQRERLDDPPASISREDLPRSPQAIVVRGMIQSVQVNVDANGDNIVGDAANEPSIAIDPTDPNKIVIGWRQFDSVQSNFRQAGYAHSQDGGSNWTFPGVLQPGQFRSDPVLAADSSGNIFYYSLSAADSAEMFISNDGGLSWTGPIPSFGGDKPWMTIDRTAGIGDSNIYATWNSQSTCCAPGTDFTRSTDGGLTYDGPFVLPEKPKWGTLDVGPDGELYVVGARLGVLSFPSPHMILRSSSAGDPLQVPLFEAVTGLDLAGSSASNGVPNPGGLMGQVWVSVDRSAGLTGGNVYVLASVNPLGSDPLDVMFIRSTDDGATWSEPVRVNDDPINSDAWQWFGTTSLAPNGRLDVVWNDTRNDPTAQTSELYYVYSIDSGHTWSSGLSVTPAWNSLVGHPQQNKIGDYYHMISDNVHARLAYSATFNGEQDVYFVRLGDCNANGRHDSADVGFTSSDCNANGIPDECEEELICPHCALDDECDDGQFCNGVETCDETCQPGVAPCPGQGCDEVAEVCIPTACNNNGVCEVGEECANCPGDCSGGASGFCGDGFCEPSLGEDCLSCGEDCLGNQRGNPDTDFCCGDGDGAMPIDCSDARCTQSGFACSDVPILAVCCGDLACDPGEDLVSCALDCSAPPPVPNGTFGAPLLVSRLDDPDGAVIMLDWDVGSCPAPGYHLIYGFLTGIQDYLVEGSACGLSTSGIDEWTSVPGGDIWFLMLSEGGDETEGSWGLDSTDTERAGIRPSDECGFMNRDNSGSCPSE